MKASLRLIWSSTIICFEAAYLMMTYNAFVLFKQIVNGEISISEDTMSLLSPIILIISAITAVTTSYYLLRLEYYELQEP